MKTVSFCPLALLIGVAADGEAEPALVKAAQEHLGRRRVALCAYSFDAPQIGDVTAKAWHSVLHGFTASLEPFLHSGSSAGSVCARTGGRERDPSPTRASGRRRASSLSSSSSRSTSPGQVRYQPRTFDPNDDPSFIPNSHTRLTVKIPALRRECLRSFSTSPCRKSILRQCAGNLPSPSTSRAPAVAGIEDPPALFPTLSRSVSTPPPAASTHAENPAALGALVPLAPCCADCEAATYYGLRAEGDGEGAYRERWTAGAKKKRAEERKEREARERCEAQAQEIKAKYSSGPASSKVGTEEGEAERAEEEARASRLGLLAAQGGVDELARERGRRGTPGALADGHHGYEDVEPVAVIIPQMHSPLAPSAAAAAVSPLSGLLASVTTEEPTGLDAPLEEVTNSVETPAHAQPLPHPPTPAAPPSQPSPADAASTGVPLLKRPPLTTISTAPASLPFAQPAPPSLSRTSSPTTASPAPPSKRRLSSAAASFSRVAAALGQGLLHTAAGANYGAGVRV